MPGKMSFRAALVAASLAALAALQVTSAQIANLPPECPQEKIKILLQPADVNDDVLVEVEFVDNSPEKAVTCGSAAVNEICKSKGFKTAVNIFHLDGITQADCQADTPPPPTGRFAVLATDCNEDLIRVLHEPTAKAVDLKISVQVFEDSDEAERACGFAAAKEACKTNPRAFATAVQITQKADAIFEGQCSA
ncbi:MAG: hypothetical protein BJ554DRAFT_1970 [Olpidium bornovanus]|uniref:Uncharacterized protein n=1 Tax=Olpidium bornovanus TaxID=278681 RepID=A0A8H7ZRJ5_9FUNG|nr:MAG: hypothetical protein BJ554DRAFT_1970 [Olpidium bornovanus]